MNIFKPISDYFKKREEIRKRREEQEEKKYQDELQEIEKKFIKRCNLSNSAYRSIGILKS